MHHLQLQNQHDLNELAGMRYCVNNFFLFNSHGAFVLNSIILYYIFTIVLIKFPLYLCHFRFGLSVSSHCFISNLMLKFLYS